MNTIENILQLIRFYWRTEKKLYLRLFLMFFAIFLVKMALLDFIFMHVNISVYNFSHTAFHTYIYAGGIFITLSYLFNAVHHKQQAINYLSLPASNIEKFLSRYILGVVGVPILINAGLVAAASVVTLFLGTMDCLAGHQPAWLRIFDYQCVPLYVVPFREALMGLHPISQFFFSFFWTNMFILAHCSFFIWFGTAFRKAGWIYAFIAYFIVIALSVFVLEVIGAASQSAPLIAGTAVRYGAVLATILFTSLAYRSFCRAQVVTHKFITL